MMDKALDMGARQSGRWVRVKGIKRRPLWLWCFHERLIPRGRIQRAVGVDALRLALGAS